MDEIRNCYGNYKIFRNKKQGKYDISNFLVGNQTSTQWNKVWVKMHTLQNEKGEKLMGQLFHSRSQKKN